MVMQKTKIVFITHMHGDHTLGILKVLSERDNILQKMDRELTEDDKIYVVAPAPIIEWLEVFVGDSLRLPEMVVIVPSMNLNPETSYYY